MTGTPTSRDRDHLHLSVEHGTYRSVPRGPTELARAGRRRNRSVPRGSDRCGRVRASACLREAAFTPWSQEPGAQPWLAPSPAVISPSRNCRRILPRGARRGSGAARGIDPKNRRRDRRHFLLLSLVEVPGKPKARIRFILLAGLSRLASVRHLQMSVQGAAPRQ
jgi:hypothetical protein